MADKPSLDEQIDAIHAGLDSWVDQMTVRLAGVQKAITNLHDALKPAMDKLVPLLEELNQKLEEAKKENDKLE